GVAYHVVEVISQEHNGHYRLERKFWFDRRDLNLTRQQIYDVNANIVTDAQYNSWNAEGVDAFAQRIAILRPGDGYQINLTVQKAAINNEIADDRFEMEPPAGVTVERIGEDTAATSTTEAPSDD
ncbi:MAG TPA: hypothetical protein VLB27_11735, partial [candidate division Zixibacteria bacterium]|nr:hypothetical protein [candidate division Zixibacteria bacterium]